MNKTIGFRNTALVLFAALALCLAGAGCGTSGGTDDSCVKNPWLCSRTTTITGRVTIPNDLSLNRSSERSAELPAASIKAFSGAAVTIGYMNSSGVITNYTGITAVTDSNGDYTLSNVPTGKNMILTASRAQSSTSTTMITLKGVYTVKSADVGTTLPTRDLSIESTFAVEAIRASVASVATSTNPIDPATLDETTVNTLVDTIKNNFAAEYTAGRVSVTALTSDSGLASQLTTLKNNIPAINTLMITVSGGNASPATVLSYSPANSTTNLIEYDGATFSVTFSKSMNSSILPTSASTFSLTIQSLKTNNSVTITQSNYSSYGTFSWTTKTLTNDTLVFTLKSNSQLAAAVLQTLQPDTIYAVSRNTVPTNLKDTDGLSPVTDTASSSTFKTKAVTGSMPAINTFVPAAQAPAVDYNSTVFDAVFNQSMSTMYKPDTSLFAITISHNLTNNVITINNSNYLLYGTGFTWATTNVANDTLRYTMKSNSQLAALNLQYLKPSQTYTIVNYYLPTNLRSANGVLAVLTSNIPTSGTWYFSTKP